MRKLDLTRCEYVEQWKWTKLCQKRLICEICMGEINEIHNRYIKKGKQHFIFYIYFLSSIPCEFQLDIIVKTAVGAVASAATGVAVDNRMF